MSHSITVAQLREVTGETALGGRVEDEIQRQIVAWWDALDQQSAHLLHVPNQGKRDRMSAVTLPAMGLRRGVADLCLMLEGGTCAWIEVKAPKGRMSYDQMDFADVCTLLNHHYRIVRSVAQFKAFVDQLDVKYREPFKAQSIRAIAWA